MLVLGYGGHFTPHIGGHGSEQTGQSLTVEVPKLALADMHTAASKTILRKFFFMVSFLLLNKFEYLSRREYFILACIHNKIQTFQRYSIFGKEKFQNGKSADRYFWLLLSRFFMFRR